MKSIKGMNPSAGTAVSRRAILKLGATVAGAAAVTLRFPAVYAAESDVLKIGWVAAMSGPGALFGEPVDFVRAQMERLFAGGLQIGGKSYSVEILLRDSQSSINVATQVAIELMTRDKVDIIVASEALAVIGAGQMAAVTRTPMVSSILPSDAVVAMRGGPVSYGNNGTPWTFHFCFATTDISEAYAGLWAPVRSRLNDTVAVSFVDQAAAQGFADPERGLPVTLSKNGYKMIDGGMFKMETQDFSNQVATFQGANAQILSGFMFADHFAALWRNAAQSKYQPEIATVAGAFLFPGGIEALGDRGDGMSTEIWWSPKLPYASSLNGQSAKDMVEEWETSTGKQWTAVLGYTHAVWEVAVQALKSASDPKDKAALQAALSKTSLDTVIGKVDFASSDVPGLARTSLVAGQWRKAKSGKFKYDLVVTYTGAGSPLAVEDEFKLLSELA
ncbi:branched-chain amino acid transport system substrate-binding protein [Rhizobium sp. SG_E_25_P2]|uniref:ABC transporter substrate-binding protein n=1 Tax=Rhizobium sp. SG_E_25_P2 TaxID=2879942 RepID=UPI0024733EC5|nr:ABC transporter substrate-binding protein [Rhizobium sp. SG_E_25_P2]MDH6265986.1 branched-chain amino acid transport system substrate-binding protein [Rhizobium sp. SG_E_25_P2]